MFKHLALTFLTLGAMFCVTPKASAEMITICSTDYMLDWPDCNCGEKLPAKFPIAIFDYKNQQALKSITGIHLTLTVQDGETAAGQLDHNKWSLGIGSVDTGLKLNGFQQGAITTLSFDWNAASGNFPSQQKLNQILQEIQTGNGQITATILDSTPNDNTVQFYSAFKTELCFTGQAAPEPASLLVWGLAACGGAVLRRRSQAKRVEAASIV